MNKKILIYGMVVLVIVAAVFTVIIYRQRAVGLSTGTPGVEDNIKANLGRGGQFAEDAG